MVATVTGVVQGVGFRPFVYRLARDRGLTGEVTNTSAGVLIDAEGDAGSLGEFLNAMLAQAPPNSRITGIEASSRTPAGRKSFEIGSSVAGTGAWQPVSPDSCTCSECLAELFDPGNRRHRYPFINCTGCGPRFTIIEGLPYDRRMTTMRRFSMCPECLAEYQDPLNRRFHAEPNACPSCGPSLWLADAGGRRIQEADPMAAAATALREGAILAIKGLGGFQLSCLACDESAVALLRERKQRPDKPFALMTASADDAAAYCLVSPQERQLLESVERPIVLLERRDTGCSARGKGAIHAGREIAKTVAPRLGRLGIMLPPSPLHFLLMDESSTPLVMTSGNRSDEPICRTNDEAIRRLKGIADFFLLHDRSIVSTYDDSVVMISRGQPAMIRRARGYAPLPVGLPASGDMLLASGGDLKNTFCLVRDDQAIVSQHIGDLEDADTLEHYEKTIMLYRDLFQVSPGRVACDSHPGYHSSALSRELLAPERATQNRYPLMVQHHRAHIASCLAENGWGEQAVGVALDGTGYGDDGCIWGGEFFTGSLQGGLKRAAHLKYMPLPGGDAAVREPWRAALGAVWCFAPEQVDFAAGRLGIDRDRRDFLLSQLRSGLNSPQTSSCGRLFDAVASLILRITGVSYEAQAPMELEAMAGGIGPRLLEATIGRAANVSGNTQETSTWRFRIDAGNTPWIIDPGPVLSAILADLAREENPAVIARRFHIALADAIVRVSAKLAGRHGIRLVALSGGVFQNHLLLELVAAGLAGRGLEVTSQQQLPSGDGGLSYGQAALAICQKMES
ncbi:MAG: carbamoyltransferase HypF [Thermoleophilia bacterium]|nr:carbamoyltransferase HypF [Thermoleophilia bacterium]